MKSKIFFIVLFVAAAFASSCGGSKEENGCDAGQIAGYAEVYADRILSADTASMDLQNVLLDIEAKCVRIEQEVGENVAETFRRCIESIVMLKNPGLASEIF